MGVFITYDSHDIEKIKVGINVEPPLNIRGIQNSFIGRIL